MGKCMYHVHMTHWKSIRIVYGWTSALLPIRGLTLSSLTFWSGLYRKSIMKILSWAGKKFYNIRARMAMKCQGNEVKKNLQEIIIIIIIKLNWTAPCANVSSGICGQRRPRLDCASAQSDLGLRCPLAESLDTRECMNGEQRLGLYFAHLQGVN